MIGVSSPFLTNMEFIFQSEMRIFFVMPYINGEILKESFSKEKRFPEAKAKFYAT